MPSIPGDWLTDLDGNRLLDEDANPIAEAAMQVLVVGGGYLITVATEGAISPGAGALILEGYVQLLKQLFPSGTEAVNVIDLLNAIKLDTDRWIPPSGLSYQAYILEIESWLQANWPTTEPGGLTTDEHDRLFGLPTSTLSASEVWDFQVQAYDVQYGHTSAHAGPALGVLLTVLSWQIGYEGVPVPDRPYFNVCVFDPERLRYYLADWGSENSTPDLPVLDLGLVADNDTVYSFLTREYPAFAWTMGGPGLWTPGGNVWLAMPGGELQCWYRCTLTDADLRSNPVTVTPPDVNVTVNVPLPPVLEDPAFERSYGATIAFTAPFVHVGACDGVIYTISTRGQGVKAFALPGHTTLTGAGVIGFTDSEGLPEKYQYMNFEAGVLVPQTMRRASGFFWSSNIALSGTVTPFTLVPITP